MKATNEQILAAYADTQSVWKAARLLGMGGQTVHRRLVGLGASRHIRVFTEEERDRLRAEYPQARLSGSLSALATSMGRTKQFICRQARTLGLTKAGGPVRRDTVGMSRRAVEWHKTHEHPRGMLGKKHTAETLAKVSAASIRSAAARSPEQWAEMTMRSLRTRAARYGSLAMPRKGVTWKGGWREIGGKRIYFRSRWEYNYAVYLQWLVACGEINFWEHEPRTFWFEAIKRGCRSYLPDFLVVERDGAESYHEVKGWMDDRSATKLKRMAKYYPAVKMVLIDKTWFAQEGKRLSWLPGWERKS